MQASTSSLTGIYFTEYIYMPPDILKLCIEDDIQKFINSHPRHTSKKSSMLGIDLKI